MNHRVVTGHHVSTTRQDPCHSICPESLEVLGVIESRQDIEDGTDEFRGATWYFAVRPSGFELETCGLSLTRIRTHPLTCPNSKPAGHCR
jgi:hypothetical protein